MRKEVEVRVKGAVQGVFFREFVKESAESLKLSGEVSNSNDGSVLVIAQGDEDELFQLLSLLRDGPPHSRVLNVNVVWRKPTNPFKEFTIIWK